MAHVPLDAAYHQTITDAFLSLWPTAHLPRRSNFRISFGRFTRDFNFLECMDEIAELQVDERFASLLFAADEGRRLGDVARSVQLKTTDPRFVQVGQLHRELLAREGQPFFYGWQLKRSYSAAELAKATILQLSIDAVFEPAGEECGTKYDERAACSLCGAGAEQVSSLVIDIRRIPKSRDIATTIAGEVLVSRRVADWLESAWGGLEYPPCAYAQRTVGRLASAGGAIHDRTDCVAYSDWKRPLR